MIQRRFIPAIRAGDTVKILTGIDRGKVGTVNQVLPGERRIVVEGVNKRVKNIRSRRGQQKGERITYFAPLALDNVQLVCPNCSKPTRVAHQVIDGKKQRSCRKCKQILTAKGV